MRKTSLSILPGSSTSQKHKALTIGSVLPSFSRTWYRGFPNRALSIDADIRPTGEVLESRKEALSLTKALVKNLEA